VDERLFIFVILEIPKRLIIFKDLFLPKPKTYLKATHTTFLSGISVFKK